MYTIGIDEAGRGALAGPVVVSVVALPKNLKLPRGGMPPLRDSKRLSRNYRKEWLNYIKSNPDIFYASARVYQGPIDRKNIAKAANIAASRALDRLLEELPRKNYSVLLDGSLFLASRNHRDIGARTIIRGDEKYASIKLASIVAKVTRDEYMIRLHKKYPDYEFPRHKGYGTKLHKLRIKKHGICDAHRLTFIKN